jgi:hypothetical protein
MRRMRAARQCCVSSNTTITSAISSLTNLPVSCTELVTMTSLQRSECGSASRLPAGRRNTEPHSRAPCRGLSSPTCDGRALDVGEAVPTCRSQRNPTGQCCAAACRQYFMIDFRLSKVLNILEANNCLEYRSSKSQAQTRNVGVVRGGWRVSGDFLARTGAVTLWSVWRIDELTERTDFLRSFRTLLPSSRFALSRLRPEASKIREASSTSALRKHPSTALQYCGSAATRATSRVPLRIESVILPQFYLRRRQAPHVHSTSARRTPP